MESEPPRSKDDGYNIGGTEDETTIVSLEREKVTQLRELQTEIKAEDGPHIPISEIYNAALTLAYQQSEATVEILREMGYRDE